MRCKNRDRDLSGRSGGTVADEAHPAFDPVSVRFELVEKSFAAFGSTKPLAVPAIDDEAEFSATMSAALHGMSPRGRISKSARRSTGTLRSPGGRSAEIQNSNARESSLVRQKRPGLDPEALRDVGASRRGPSSFPRTAEDKNSWESKRFPCELLRCRVGHSIDRKPMIWPRRTKVSTRCFVCLSRSSDGRQIPGSPNTTMAEPPKRKADFSLPRRNGASSGCS
jgi:hypothetical protein